MKCSYCKNDFSSKSILNYHQKTAKYCLKIQESKGVEIKYLFQCEFCYKNMSQQIDLERHQIKCSDKKESEITNKYQEIINIQQQQINEQKQTIKDLQDKIENIAIKAVQRNFENETTIDIDDTLSDSQFTVDESDNDTDEVNEYKLTPLEVGQGYTIEHREEDGYINVTNLCKAGDKQYKHWFSLQKTKAFLQVLSSSVGIPTNELIKYSSGSIKERATWSHPQVAINISQWISPRFDVKVSGWVYEIMMTGKVDITNTKTYKELQLENKNKELKIP